MRTDTRPDSAYTSLLVAAALATALLSGPATEAAQITFRPAVVVRVFEDGNANVVGEDEVSDTVSTVTLDLRFESETPSTTWGFSYRPYRESFSDSSDFDNTGHVLATNVRHEISRRASLNLDVYGARTERQLVRLETIDIPDSVVPRTTLDRAFVQATGRVGMGSRSFVTWRAGGGLTRYDDVAPSPSLPDGQEFEDADFYDLGVGWGRQISRRTSLGVDYAFRDISLETKDSTESHSIGFTGDVQFGPKLSARGRLGVLQIESAGDSETTASFDFRVTRTVDRGSNLVFGLRQLVTPGTGSSGATEDRGGYVSWRYRGSRRYQADALVRYWRRETVRPGTESDRGTEGVQSSESVLWNVGQYLALGLFHVFTDQSSIGPEDPFLDTSYHSGGVTLRWEIRGRVR